MFHFYHIPFAPGTELRPNHRFLSSLSLTLLFRRCIIVYMLRAWTCCLVVSSRETSFDEMRLALYHITTCNQAATSVGWIDCQNFWGCWPSYAWTSLREWKPCQLLWMLMYTSTSFWWLRAGQLGTMWHSTGTQFDMTEADHPNLKLQLHLDSTLPVRLRLIITRLGLVKHRAVLWYSRLLSIIYIIISSPISNPAWSTKHHLN